jgi:hypothetical protein
MEEGKSKMMYLWWIDFRGTEAELKEIDKLAKTVAEKVKGVEYLGRFSPLNAKWNWTYFWKIPSMATWEEIDTLWSKIYKRDYSKLTHDSNEFFMGPL